MHKVSVTHNQEKNLSEEMDPAVTKMIGLPHRERQLRWAADGAQLVESA